MSNHTPIISLHNVGVCYQTRKSLFGHGQLWALEHVSFNLFQGESLGVIGRNGAGKSTLLKLLGGIIRPDRGELVNTGHTTALLSLQAGFSPNLNGRDNIILSGLLLGLHKQAVIDQLDQIISFAELENAIDQPVRTYSSGMKARLGFAIAAQLDPDILLIDEVLGVGDKDFREKSSHTIRKKIQSDQTVVLVSHNIETVRKLCNRVVWIENGESKAEGKTEEIISLYLNNKT